LGLAAAVVYTTYILTSQGVADRVSPLVLSALVSGGAAAMLTLAGAVNGGLNPGELSAAGFGWLAGIALISTVVALSLFFAGLRLVGPTTASILSTAEPLTAVLLAFLMFGESLSAVQLGGGALVLAGVLVLSARRRAPAPATAGHERPTRKPYVLTNARMETR
jgi:drug/metabolite transporter (DMT)-like permease